MLAERAEIVAQRSEFAALHSRTLGGLGGFLGGGGDGNSTGMTGFFGGLFGGLAFEEIFYVIGCFLSSFFATSSSGVCRSIGYETTGTVSGIKEDTIRTNFKRDIVRILKYFKLKKLKKSFF